MILPCLVLAALLQAQAPAAPATPRVAVFLDCEFCDADYLREEVAFVEYVRDRTDAGVHVLVTTAETGARGREYTVAFIGQGRFAATSRTATFTTDASDTDDRIRRRLATAITIGLLEFASAGGIPPGLEVAAEIEGAAAPSAAGDPWKRWIFSLNGDAEYDAEESTRERSWTLSMSADRVTPEWKWSISGDINQQRQQFDLDEDEPFAVQRQERGFRWLVVRSLGDHWSAGTLGRVRSSTFENTALEVTGSPAVEWNFFPYAMYTRRQLRVLYAVGPSHARYHEETLFGEIRETRLRQELSGTYEQREPWGTIESRLEWSNYFPGLSTHRVGFDSEIDVRVARGLSLSIEASASRIRDQISLPRRDATSEEVLLRLRELRSGFEVSFSVGIEYQFGSAFAAIVNPRFGR